MSTWCDEGVIPFDAAEMPLRIGTPLYGLVPAGLGTAFQESLRGYLVRLAVEHNVKPRELVGRVLATIDPSIADWCYARFFSANALTIDGLGSYAKAFSDALNCGTGRRDLQTLTLQPWEGLLAPNGHPLLARVPRWCSCCLSGTDASHLANRDRLGRDEASYWQLRWSLSVVTRCPIHDCALVDRCPRCGRHQPAIPRQPSLTRCDHCGHALGGNGRSGEVGDSSDGSTEGSAIVDGMISIQRRLNRPPRENWTSFLQEAVIKLGDGRRATLCRRMGFQPRALNAWLRGEERTALEVVVRLCAALRCSAESVFADGGSEPSAEPQKRPGRQAVRHPQQIRDAAGARLVQAVRDEAPLPLKRLAESVGVSRAYMKYWHADLAARLIDTRAGEARRRRCAQLRERAAFIETQIAEALQSGIVPGRKLVERLVREAGFSLMEDGWLDLYREILRRRGLLA